MIFLLWTLVVVSETASKGTSVAKVTVSMIAIQIPYMISACQWYLCGHSACVSCSSQATDRDSGVNRQIEFEVTSVHFENLNNHTTDEGMVFEAVTIQQKDDYIGMIQWVQSHSSASCFHNSFWSKHVFGFYHKLWHLQPHSWFLHIHAELP